MQVEVFFNTFLNLRKNSNGAVVVDALTLPSSVNNTSSTKLATKHCQRFVLTKSTTAGERRSREAVVDTRTLSLSCGGYVYEKSRPK